MARIHDSDVRSELAVTLRFFGSIRAAAGSDEAAIDVVSGRTVYELLQSLAERYGVGFREEIFATGGNAAGEDELRDDLTVSVGGVIIGHANLRRKIIENGDEIALLPTFPGGG
ncbi:MAG: MoaD/ThiS family protein [Oscillospiraceae bacterium]|nr:MoaD/ThiS family protein [Oscillospiraceae bacterium]